MDISYDGRLAVTTHCDGTAIKWDIKYGSKMSVFNKQRKSYDQIILVCDRLGAFAQNENDIKYEKFTWINKNFPKICKRFTNRNDDECKSNNISLKNVPNYLEINIECNDDKDDKDEYDEDDDESFLNEIDQEFDIINNSINECIETNNIDILKKNIRSLMEENKALKGEIIEWKSLHQNLYNMKIDT